MADPNNIPEQDDNDDWYVSPTSDDTLRERYEKVKAMEASMTDEELLALLRQPSPFFDDEDIS